MKATAKKCATKFACGSSVSLYPSTNADTVIIQGEVGQAAGEYLVQLYPDILTLSCISYK